MGNYELLEITFGETGNISEETLRRLALLQ